MTTRITGSLWFCKHLTVFDCMPSFIHRRRTRYEKRKRRDSAHTTTYHFVGYSSLYPFYYYPERIRLRLRFALSSLILGGCFDKAPRSQFVITTPYQRHGHGCMSYLALALQCILTLNQSRTLQSDIPVYHKESAHRRANGRGSRRSVRGFAGQKRSTHAFGARTVHGRSIRTTRGSGCRRNWARKEDYERGGR